MFCARVTVVVSYSYDTQIDGSTTVPQLHVDGITVLNLTLPLRQETPADGS